MARIRIRLLDMAMFIAFVAFALALKVHADRPSTSIYEVADSALALYVAVLSVAGIAARAGRHRWRPYWGGFALFGAVYLATGLQFGWGSTSPEASAALLFRCKLALPLALLCGLASKWLVTPNPSAPEHPTGGHE